MSDLITKLMEFLPVWVLPMIVLFYINYKALTNYKDNPDSFNTAAALLKKDTYGATYRNLLGKMLDKLADWLGDKSSLKPRYIHNNKQSYVLVSNNRFFTNNPFTPASYERLLQLAFIYPILSFLIFWAMGGDGEIADFDWLIGISTIPHDTRWPLLVFGFFAPILTALWLKYKTIKNQIIGLTLASIYISLVHIYFRKYPAFESTFIFLKLFTLSLLLGYMSGWFFAWLWLRDKLQAHQLIYPIVFAFAFAINIAGIAGDAVEGSVGAVVLAIIVAVAAAVAGITGVIGSTIAFTFFSDERGLAFAGAFIGGLFVIQSYLKSLYQKKQKEGFFWLFYSFLLVIFTIFIISHVTIIPYKIFLLFYLLFPLLNAPIDWLSLGITRGLLQSIRHKHHSGWLAFAWALLDALLAIFFLLLVSAVLVLAIGFVDSELLHTILIEISDIIRVDRFCVAKTDNYNWLYTMLLTTLIPTLAHFAIAASALTLWLPQKWRHYIADRLQYNYYKQIAAATYLTITPFIGLLAPIALLYGLYLLLNAHGGMLANILLNWAELLAGLF